MATTPYPFVSGAVLTASQLNSTYNVPINAQTATYVLVATDGGKRVQMNAAGATTITVNTGLFAAGDSLFIQNIGAGTCTITAGTCTVSTASSLALAQFGGGTLYFTSASVAVFFSQVSVSYGTATGGTSSSITVSGQNYTLLTFTTDGTLTVTKKGLFDILLVGGGAGAGGGDAGGRVGAGGGGGDVVGFATVNTIFLEAGTNTVDVGAGGTGAAFGVTTNGLKSTLAGYIAIGGGNAGGVSHTTDATYTPLKLGGNGGSGGGSTALVDSSPFGKGIGISGNNGGNNSGGYSGTATTAGGGGGGSGSVGGSIAGGTTGGAGGNGTDISSYIASATLFVAAGGGGGATGTGGAAGSGGVAGKTSGAGNAGVNFGAGGGGTNGATGGAGAAGVIYVRFKI